MKKKLLITMMALTLTVSSIVPASAATATYLSSYDDDDDDAYDDDVDYGDDEDDDDAGLLDITEITVKPAKKTIKVGKSFTISLEADPGSDYEDMPDEEWEELIENNVDNISFRSSKTSVASVNKKTGKVKGKKKGNAIIKTTVDLANGQSATWKTKVYVTK